MKLTNLILLLFFGIATNLLSQENPILQAAEEELKRTMQELADEEVSPYFISYTITDIQSVTISSSLGKLSNYNENEERILDIDLRVGDYSFDNTHIIRGNPFQFGSRGGRYTLPLDNNPDAIKKGIWFATDVNFKEAVERYKKAKTNQAVKVQEEDTSADFSRATPEEYYGDIIDFEIDSSAWNKRLRELSSEFKNQPLIYNSNVSFRSEILTKRFITSEGTKLKWYESGVRMYINAKTKAEDGMSLPLYESYFAFHPDDLPSNEEILIDIKEMISLLLQLREAPVANPYSGPVMLSGEASGVFFHEIFGHRIEGHREKDPNSSQTFKKSVGKKILPEYIDVVFDPTKKSLGNKELAGYYLYDDQGIKSEKVVTVDDGIFQSFLMSRSPIEGFPESNGHGRKQAGFQAVSRQSNLIVESRKSVPQEELFDMLREEAGKQNKDFAFYFDKVSGGFTFTARVIPNAFNVTPLVVYKVYTDGRPNELVRGVDLIGTPLATFEKIIAASQEIGVFNGICGAESGGVPVSASSPSLLISLIETQKKKKSQAKPPILDSPLETYNQ